MNKKIKDNKKLSLLLGIITFLILIIGSTYSYFAVVTSSSYSMRSVSAEAENLGSGDSFTTENAFGNTVNAKIGLMYMYDYYYANNWDGTQVFTSGESTVKYNTEGWIHITHGGSYPNNYEWLLSRYVLYSAGYYNFAWYVYLDGHVDFWYDLTGRGSVRPVFYLKSNVNILGSGTISDPYTIS